MSKHMAIALNCPGKWRALSRLPAHLGPPPAHADQQKSPVVEKLRLFAFEGMADELQNPSQNKQRGGVDPQGMKKDASNRQRQGKHDQRNAKAVAQPVHRMSVAAGILRDPLFAAASA